MTVRQLLYRLVGLGVIAKTETEYKHTVVRLLSEMRRSRDIPFGWLADNTRWQRKPTTYSSLEEALRRTTEAYRRAQWDTQDCYVEVWIEKDALAGVVYEVTEPWDVPLMVTRGYPSLSYLYEAAENIQARGKPAYIYYLGDRDPSGLDITRAVEKGLREFAPRAEISFERIAVTSDQVEWMGLPTRPTKTDDSRTGSFTGDSVEVDAIPSRDLRWLVESAITAHVDDRALRQLKLVENEERKVLHHIYEVMTTSPNEEAS